MAFELPAVIPPSREQGLQRMASVLMRLTKEGKITAGDAYVKAVSKKDFEPFVEEEEKAAAQRRAPNFKTVAVAPGPTPAPPPAPAQAPPPRPPPQPHTSAGLPAAARRPRH